MTEGLVQPSAVSGASGDSIVPPTITFDDDATFGTYIRQITASGITFNFAPCSMFGMGLFDTADGSTIELIDEDWDIDVETDDATGIVTITFGHEDYTGIAVEATLTPKPDGYTIAISMVNSHSTIGVEWAAFPRLGCKAHSGDPDNAYIAHGILSGVTLTQPHLRTLDGLLQTPEAPPAMQFFSYFDIDTKIHLYVAFEDEDGWVKRWSLFGDGSSVSVQDFRHFFQNPRRANNGSSGTPYDVTYETRIALFKGLTEDGRCGAYDAALRYKAWANDPARPWMDDGPWDDDASSVSDRIRNSDLYMVGWDMGNALTPWTSLLADWTRVQTFVGATEMVATLYNWGANLGTLIGPTFRPPAHLPITMSSNMSTAMGMAQSAGVHVAWYTFMGTWDDTLTNASNSPFGYDAFTGTTAYGNLLQYMVRDHDDDGIGLDPNPLDPPIVPITIPVATPVILPIP